MFTVFTPKRIPELGFRSWGYQRPVGKVNLNSDLQMMLEARRLIKILVPALWKGPRTRWFRVLRSPIE